MNPTKETIIFNEALHLELTPPKTVKTLEFDEVVFPYQSKGDFKGFAYSEPFRLLSDTGVSECRSILKREKDLIKQTQRSLSQGGLVYRSKFICDLLFSPSLCALFSEMANVEIWPNNMHNRSSQANYSDPKSSAKVDLWHVDSVDYVCVIILSDIKDMEGGELQVLELIDRELRPGVVATSDILAHKDKIRTVNYPGPGYCIFMQGSMIKHGVNPVRRASEPRITLVNSYSPLDVFIPDRTEPYVYTIDSHHVRSIEYTRHKARRCEGQLQYMHSLIQRGEQFEDCELEYALESASAELHEAARKLREKDRALNRLANSARSSTET